MMAKQFHGSPRASIKKSSIKKAERAARAQVKVAAASDSFVNYGLNLGIGANNALSQSSYGFTPITMVRTLLDFIHRGSWLGGIAIDLLAKDMTRGGIELLATNTPEDDEHIQQEFTRLRIWQGLKDNTAWAKLYGGSIAVMLIDGQNPETPLRVDTVGKGKFKGLMVLDRWMVEPDLQRLVAEYGPHMGNPEFYRVISDAPAMRGQRIHYTRVVRQEGIRLPYWQRIMNNLWGLSVFERLYDRMIAFDSATMGAAQLVYKSYIRTYGIKGYKEIATAGGPAAQGIAKLVEAMRKYQGIEGVTLIDADDKFEGHQTTSFTGISDALLQFSQQLAGALQIPLVRLMGQSPAGLSSTGESDLRTYYDGILTDQENELREGVNTLLRVTAKSLGINLPENFGFNFVPLWQLNEDEKSQISDRDTRLVIETEAAGLISQRTALQELQQHAKITGRWTNITEEMISEADDTITPPEAEMAMAGEGGEEGLGSPEGKGSAAGEGNGGPTGKERPEAPQAAGGPNGAEGVNIGGLERLRKIKKLVGKGGDAWRNARDHIPYTEVGGIQVVIEYPRGSIRSGNGWSHLMSCDYGYIRRVPSAEGETEWLDTLVGPDHSSRDVWVVDVINPFTSKFDEHKVCLGFSNSHDALAAFRSMYKDSPVHNIGAVTHFSMDEGRFKDWLANGDMTKPLALERVAA